LRVDGKYYDYVRMGVRFPILLKVNGRIVVIIPQKGDGGRLVFKNGMLNERDIHLGYLPYSPETILTQAFKSFEFSLWVGRLFWRTGLVLSLFKRFMPLLD